MPMHCGLHIQLVTVDVIYSWYCLNNTFIASTQWAGPLSRLYLLLLVSLYRCRGLMRTWTSCLAKYLSMQWLARLMIPQSPFTFVPQSFSILLYSQAVAGGHSSMNIQISRK